MSLLENYLSPQALRSAKIEKLKRRKKEIVSDEWRRYIDDPIAFVYDLFEFPEGEKLAPYQEQALTDLVEKKRVSFRGPHGLGKTTLASLAILWFICTRPENTKIPCTASSWKQVEKYLWTEVRKWYARLDWDKWAKMGGKKPEFMARTMKMGKGEDVTAEAFIMASDNEELIEGAHDDNLLYVFDESKAIPDKTWDAAEGAFSTGDPHWLAISTPGDRSGRFYEIQRHAPGFEDWHVSHIKLEQAIEAGRIRADWAEARLRQWGKDSPVYQARVKGEFPEQSEDALISLGWIEAARLRDVEPEGKPRVGVDIARFGTDDSAMIGIQGDAVLGAETWHGNDLMTTTGKIIERGFPANVDEIGVGAGVVDRLKEQKFPVNGINVSVAAIDKEHFYNLRAELYWNLRIRFKDGEIDLSRIDQSLYDRLSGELTAIKFTYTSKGQIKIESKADIKKRTGRSPDLADALMLAFAPEPSPFKIIRLGQ